MVSNVTCAVLNLKNMIQIMHAEVITAWQNVQDAVKLK